MMLYLNDSVLKGLKYNFKVQDFVLYLFQPLTIYEVDREIF
jgi:hypothetical protein